MKDLREFRDAYVNYLNLTLSSVMAGDNPGHTSDRTRVLALAVRASRAADAVGVFVAVTPPPFAAGRQPITGLAGVAFSHEDPIYRTSADRLLFPEYHKQGYDLALDAVDSADAQLVLMFEAEVARRRRPTYWIDRTLRAVLGFPAYLLSLAFGFDRHELSPGSARTLWLFSLVVDVLGVVAFGRAWGWW